MSVNFWFELSGFALSSGPGLSGIAVIRISGTECKKIVSTSLVKQKPIQSNNDRTNKITYFEISPHIQTSNENNNRIVNGNQIDRTTGSLSFIPIMLKK